MSAAFHLDGVWRSLVAHLVWDQRVGGSNPLAPTNFSLINLRGTAIHPPLAARRIVRSLSEAVSAAMSPRFCESTEAN